MKRMSKCLWFFSALLTLLTSCIGDDIIFDTVAEQISINNPIDTLAYDSVYQFEATFFNHVGKAEMRPIEWASADTNIVTISTTGLAKGITEGMTMITAQAEGNAETISNSFMLAVGANTTASATERTGTLRTTSSYALQGGFILKEDKGDMVLSFDADYKASTALPGLYIYMTNNPNTSNGALEIGPVEVFSGEHSYTLPDEVELNTYNYVLYYCKPFRVKVGDGKFDE